MELTGRTHLYAILADPVDHVRAPVFFNPVFDRLGLDARLIPLHVRPADLADAVAMLPRFGNLKGVILTVPHKEAATALCDTLGDEAQRVGAVNAVRFAPHGVDDASSHGDMFDGVGFVDGALANDISFTERNVLMVGAGGAARAIAFAVIAAGARNLVIANRTAARAEALATAVNRHYPGTTSAGPPDPAGFDVVINATSLGLHDGEPLPFPIDRLAPHADVVDIVVPITPLQSALAGRPNRCIGGRPMVDCQIAALARFFGEPVAADADIGSPRQ